MPKSQRHLIVPDTQIKPGVKLDHLRWAGLYCAAKKPDRTIIIGDWWDMSSLSSYDKGKKSFEGRRYRKDIASGNKGLNLFFEPIYEEKERCLERGEPWECTFDFTEGNHEYRAERVMDLQPEFYGMIGRDTDFIPALAKYGVRFHPFLDVVNLDGVAYAHFFTSGVKGLPVPNARLMLNRKHISCIMGHVQRYEVAIDYDANGKRLTGLFSGCYYQHKEDYRDAQSNAATWHGIHMLYGVRNGEFTHNSVELSYLRDRFKGK
jgi:hypothetical protein